MAERERVLFNASEKAHVSQYFNSTYDPSWIQYSYQRDVDGGYLRKKGMADVVTPNFKKERSTGKIIQSPMIYLDFTCSTLPLGFQTIGPMPGAPSYRYFYDQTFVIPFRPEVYVNMEGIAFWYNVTFPNTYQRPAFSEFEADRDYAVQMAWANVDVSEMQALASLGELPETIKWIVSIFSRLIKILKTLIMKRNRSNLLNSLKLNYEEANRGSLAQKKYLRQYEKLKKKFSESKKDTNPVDIVSDLWLEWRYAIRPLAFELQSALKALQAVVKKGSRQTARGWHKTNPAGTFTTDIVIDANISGRVSTKRFVSTNFRGGVLYQIDSDINSILALWGLDQPLESIWELVPFSFIIDWFFNIGDIIGSWASNPSLSPLSSWLMEEIHIVEETSLEDVWTTNSYFGATFGAISKSITPGSSKQTIHWKHRIPTPSRSITPRFNIKLDTAKIFDLTAIARSLFFSRK